MTGRTTPRHCVIASLRQKGQRGQANNADHSATKTFKLFLDCAFGCQGSTVLSGRGSSSARGGGTMVASIYRESPLH